MTILYVEDNRDLREEIVYQLQKSNYQAVGLKNGQRAVGKIMNKNPYPVIIPCHRVVMSTGKIGGYAYGEHVKTKMLSDEGIEIQNGKILELENKIYRF